jgi:histidinol-phosphate aminotransferase
MSRFFSDKYKSLSPYVPGEQPQDRKYVKLNTNESPFPPSPIAQRLAREAAGDLYLYSDPDSKQLAEAAAQYYGVGTENLVFSNGSDDLINFACMAFCDAEHPATFPDVTYGFYPVVCGLNGVPYVEKPLRPDFSIDPADYVNCAMTVFLSNPNAQTGLALPLSDVERIVRSNPDNVVIVDEAYVDFGAESAVSLVGKYDNVLVLQTLSKSRSLAGGRLGVGIGNAELISDIHRLRYSTNPYNVNRMTAAAGIGAFADVRYFETCRKAIMETRAFAKAEFEKLGFEATDSKANYLRVRSPEIGGKDLYLALKERGILIRHFETERLRDWNRVTIGSRDQMETLFAAIREILEK